MEEFAHPKPKEASFETSSASQLKTLEEADAEYWENVKLAQIFEDMYPIHTYTERTFLSENQTSSNVHQYKTVLPRLTSFSSAEESEQLLQFVDKLRVSLVETLSSRHYKEFEALMEKRYFLIQQKFLSLERTCLRRKQLNDSIMETSPNPSLEFCLNIVSPMLSAYDSVPLQINFQCIDALIKHATNTNIAGLINLLHSNNQPLQYPPQFITKVRDWIEILLKYIQKKDPNSDQNSDQSIQRCILSLLDFGLVTTSVGCLLKASQNLLEQTNHSAVLHDQIGFALALQRLFSIAQSEPQCFHHIDHFPMSVPDRKKYQKQQALSHRELYCITVDYTESTGFKNTEGSGMSHLVLLYEGGIISSVESDLYQIPVEVMREGEPPVYPRHIVCIHGVVIWYSVTSDSLECFELETKKRFAIKMQWPEGKGSREIGAVFSEGEYIYFVTGQSATTNEPDEDNHEDPATPSEQPETLKDSLSSIHTEKEKKEDKEKILESMGTISEAQRLATSKEVVVFKFTIDITARQTENVFASVLDHGYGPWTRNSYFVSDGKWLIITGIQQKESYHFLYAEFASPIESEGKTEGNGNICRVRAMQPWGTDPDWFCVNGPIAWDLKYKKFWEYDLKEKIFAWTTVRCSSPKFLRAMEHLSAQYLLQRTDPPASIFKPVTSPDAMEAAPANESTMVMTSEQVSLYIVSALDHIIQVRHEGVFTTERSSSVFEAILSMLEHYSSQYLQISNEERSNYWSTIAGVIGTLRILKVQIANCLNEKVALEVGLSRESKDKSCTGIRIREILFELIQYCGSPSTMHDMQDVADARTNEIVKYIQKLSTEILFSFVEVLYHPDELGDLIQSMVTRDTSSPQYSTFISLLNQMANVSNPSLLILTPLAESKADTQSESDQKPCMEVKLSILNCLFQILGEEFIAALNNKPVATEILESAGSLLTTIQGTLTLDAWRTSKEKFSSVESITKGSPLWVYCTFGDELLAYCIALLQTIDFSVFDQNDFKSALQNPLFTELLPAYVYSFWLSGNGKQALQIFYKQSGPFMDLLQILNQINQQNEEVLYAERVDLPNNYRREFTVVESKHPYMTENSAEDLCLVDIITHPGALFMRLKFDPRSRIDKYDEIKFYKDNQFSERARLIMKNKIYHGIIDDINETFPQDDIVYIGDTVILGFESYSYNSEHWGFRLEVSAFFPIVPVPKPISQNQYPLLDLERAIAIVYSSVINQLFKDPWVSSEYLQLEKSVRKWLDLPTSVLHYGTTVKTQHHAGDEFESILPGCHHDEVSFIQSVLHLSSDNIITFLNFIKEKSRKPLPWTLRYAELFEPMDRSVFASLLYHSNMIWQAIDIMNKIVDGSDVVLSPVVRYLWEQAQSIQQWAKNRHQQHNDVPFESICRAICTRAKFLLTAYKTPSDVISKEISIKDVKIPVQSALSFLKVEDLSLDGILEVLHHRSTILRSRSIALELQHQLLHSSCFASVKYCSLSKLSLPRHILYGLEGCDILESHQITELYVSLLRFFVELFFESNVLNDHHHQLLCTVALSLTVFMISRVGDDKILQSARIFDKLHQMLLASTQTLHALSASLSQYRQDFLASTAADGEKSRNNLNQELTELLRQHRNVQTIYNATFHVFCAMGSQCLAQRKLEMDNEKRIPICDELQGEIVSLLVEILEKTKTFDLPQSREVIDASLRISDLTTEQLSIYSQINERIQDHSSDCLCYDILSFLYSLTDWGVDCFSILTTSHVSMVQLLLELLFHNTPRVQLLSLRYCSLLLHHVAPSELEEMLSSLSEQENQTAIQITRFSEVLLVLFDSIGWTIGKEFQNADMEEVSNNESTATPVIGEKRLKSHEETSNDTPKRHKAAHFLESVERETCCIPVTRHPLADSLFSNRRSIEQVAIAQEICSFLRSLLLQDQWKDIVLASIYEAINNISNLLCHSEGKLNSADIQIHYQRLIAALSLIGGQEEIATIRDIVWILPEDDEVTSHSKQRDEATLLDRIGLFSYIHDHSTSQCIVLPNERIVAKARVPYEAAMVPLSFQHLKQLLSLINKQYLSSNSYLLLLGMAQRAVVHNMFQFMKYEEIVKHLATQIVDISLTLRPESSREYESLESLKNKLLAFKDFLVEKPKHQEKATNEDDKNQIPSYYYDLKKQFEREFPYSIFHSINIAGLGSPTSETANNMNPIPNHNSLLVPCGMKASGGTKITNEIVNSSNILTLTVVTWANYSIPRFPLLVSFYFEVEILCIAPGGDVGIGLLDDQADCDHSGGSQIGSVMGSFAFINNGSVLAESPEPDEQQALEKYSEGDIVGCILTYTSDEGDYLLSFTKNGRLLRFKGEEDGCMHLPNLKLKFIPIIGLRGNGSRVSVNFGHKAFVYDTSEIMERNRNNTSLALPIPAPIVLPNPLLLSNMDSLSESGEEADDDDETMGSDTDSHHSELLSPHDPSNVSALSHALQEDVKSYAWHDPSILQTKKLVKGIQFTDTSTEEWLSCLSRGDYVLLNRNSTSESDGFYQRLATVAMIDYVAQFILVIQRRADLACSRSWWVRFQDVSIPRKEDILSSSHYTIESLQQEILLIEKDITLLEARETFLQLLSSNLSCIIQAHDPIGTNNKKHYPKVPEHLIQKSQCNIIATMILEDTNNTSQRLLQVLRLFCSQYTEHSIVHESDLRRLPPGSYHKLPHSKPIFQYFRTCFLDYLSLLLCCESLPAAELQVFSLLFESISETEMSLPRYPPGVTELLSPPKISKMNLQRLSIAEPRLRLLLGPDIAYESTIHVENSTHFVIIPNRDSSRATCVSIYTDELKQNCVHRFMNDRRVTIRPVVIQQDRCTIVVAPKSSFDCLVLPCGELRVSEENSIREFNFPFYFWTLSLLCDIQYTNRNKELRSHTLEEFLSNDQHLRKLCSLLELENCLVRPYLSLLICKMIGTRSELNRLPISLLKNELTRMASVSCPKSVPLMGKPWIQLSICELLMSILYAEKDYDPNELDRIEENKPEQMAIDDILFLQEDSPKPSVIAEMLGEPPKGDSEKQLLSQKIAKYFPIIKVIPVLMGTRNVSPQMFNSLLALHYISTVVKESDHPCKHSQRERVSFPGASCLFIYFDHRCKLDYSDRLTFSVHNRRGADDLGRFHFQPKWNTIEVPGDCFYYELKVNKNPECERFEYGFRFTAVPVYDSKGIENILHENQEDVTRRKELLEKESVEWTDEMNVEFISFVQNLAVLHSRSPTTMTPADLLSLMTSKPSNEDEMRMDEGETDSAASEVIQMPDPAQYPNLIDVPLHDLQYRYALVYTLNHQLNALLANTEMDLVHEWWSLASKLKQLRSLIFTSTKLEFLRLTNTIDPSATTPFRVTIDRRLAQDSNLARDSAFHQLHRQLYDRVDILRNRAFYQSQPFEVNLLQEGAIDQGGPYRDCLMQVIADTQGKNSTFALFIEPSNGDNYECYIPNPKRKDLRYLSLYQFVGQLLGMCLRTGDSLPYYLAPVVWKWLVDENLSHADYEMLDPSFRRIIKLLEQEESGEFYDEMGSLLTFTVFSDSGESVELVEGGQKKKVTQENKRDYFQLMIQHHMKEYEQQLISIKEGFLQIVPSSVVPLLTASELHERIAGKRDIDIEYLKQHTFYDGIAEDSPVVKYFWDALRSFTNEQRSMFLRFVWGRSTLPPSPEEFTEKFCITAMISNSVTEDLSEDEILPHAHTCAFQIELPQYSSEKIMREKLLYAITNCRDIDLEWQSSSSQSYV